MKRYHPDRVNQLGEELQRVAHQKTLDIQRGTRSCDQPSKAPSGFGVFGMVGALSHRFATHG